MSSHCKLEGGDLVFGMYLCGHCMYNNCAVVAYCIYRTANFASKSRVSIIIVVLYRKYMLFNWITGNKSTFLPDILPDWSGYMGTCIPTLIVCLTEILNI